MITDPKNIVFENSRDIVDYISKGIPPTKKQYERLMYAVNHPLKRGQSLDGVDVVIYEEDIANWSNSYYIQSTVNEILDEVHRNRIRNAEIAIATGVVTVIAGNIIRRKICERRKMNKKYIKDNK